MNKKRIRNSAEVMQRLMSREQVELFFRNFYNTSEFSVKALDLILGTA